MIVKDCIWKNTKGTMARLERMKDFLIVGMACGRSGENKLLKIVI